jgi:putative tryptophan/tyrosine transport system ATP-binding protein
VTNGQPILEVKDLTVSFSRWGQTTKALDGLSFSVPQGQWVILVGANGAGKSVCLRAISGRVEPDSGEILINGRDAATMSSSARADAVFYVHQDPLLGTAPTLTVYENLVVADYDLRSSRESRKHIVNRYHELLKPLGLADRLRQPVKTLSGGERQLLALLIARLRPAALILLDEVLASLDPRNVDMCLEQIALLHKSGKTLIQVTHDERHASVLGDRTIAMSAGQIVYDGLASSRVPSTIRRHYHSAPGAYYLEQ